MKLLSIAALICAICAGAPAQSGGIIKGIVSYKGKPVSGAVVTAASGSGETEKYTAVTDADGRYYLGAVEGGEYTISARSDAGGTLLINKEAAPVVIADGETLEANLQLDVAAIINERVTISADMPQTIEQVSKTVDVIDAQELRDRADFALVDTLRTIPGFRLQQLGGFGRAASVKTRGLRNQDTALLIDGIRFRDASAITGDASAFLSDFTLTSVSRIEVLRGSGSSLYGTNAIGGTIDFQTPLPQAGLRGQISAAAGGLGLKRFRGNISDGTRDGKFGFTLTVSRTGYTEGIDGSDNAHNTNFQSRVEYSPSKKTTLSARFFVSDAFVRLNASPDTLGVPPETNRGITEAIPGVNFIYDLDDPDSTQRSNFFNGQLVLTHAFSSELLFVGSYSGLKTSRKNDDGPLGPGFQSSSTSIFDGMIQTANGRISWVPSSANKLTAGYEFETENFGNEGSTPDGTGNFFTRASQSSQTIYVQNLLQLFGRRVQLAGGARAQFFDLKSPKFSLTNAPYSGVTTNTPPPAYTFDGSASYNVSTGTKIRAHVGNGYRVPSLYERFGTFFSSFGVPSFVALGDPGLKPEKTIALDAGIEQALFKGRARLSATYFYTRLLETINFGNAVPDIGSTQRPFGGYLNTKGGIARGAEFSARLSPARSTEIFASYTYTNSDQRSPQIAGSGILQTLGIPSRQFSLVATQRIGRFWANVDFSATNGYLAPIFSSSSFNSYVYRFRGGRRADLTAGYRFPLDHERLSLWLFGTIENLFDYEYFENGFRTVGRNARAGLALNF